jgi:tRNA modification GTPase
MNLSDTIVAPASAPGWSSRAFIRASGPDAFRALTDACTAPPPALSRGIRPVRLRLGSSSLPVLALIFPAPNSYTGQDAFELQFPGNPHLTERLLAQLLSRPGLRMAEPGEFTARAYLNNRLTIDQAEGVAAIIAAQTDEQLAAASSLLSGRTGVAYRAWADELATLLALTEAGIDFTDQDDVVAIAPTSLRDRLVAFRRSIADHLGSETPGAVDAPLPSVVLVGAPNAGKSTLFNTLLGRRRAVVSDVAGTTRDVLSEELDLSAAAPGAGPVMLTDLPGLDSATTGAADAAAQEAARAALARADVALWCDPRADFDRSRVIPDLAPFARVVRVRTKADLPSGEPDPSALPVCALDGYNLGPLKRAIADQAVRSRAAGVAGLLPRHRRALARTLESIDAALALIVPSRAVHAELIAPPMREGLDHLGELIGRISPDDIIGRVFATFCVGK